MAAALWRVVFPAAPFGSLAGKESARDQEDGEEGGWHFTEKWCDFVENTGSERGLTVE